jgi:hypothetical protein
MKTTRYALAATFLALSIPCFAQTPMAPMTDHGTSVGGKPLASPAATAEVQLGGQTITVKYNSPSMRGRKIMGELVPYGQEWRTGANPATTLITPVDLMIGSLKVPAGTYTIFTLPSDGTWQFIVSTKTGEWGIPYPKGFDLGRTPMKSKPMDAPQEAMSITFEHTVKYTTQLHIKWENTDQWVNIVDTKDMPRTGGIVGGMPKP